MSQIVKKTLWSQSILRDMRSKHFFSSGLRLTWQVKRLRFTGGALAYKDKR